MGARIRPGLERRTVVETVGLPKGLSVRALRASDIEAVVAIETEAFSSPWRAETFAGLLDRSTVELLVMVDPDETVVGYAVVWCIVDQGELANLAIAPSRRGAGLGAHLLREVIAVCRRRGVTKLFLEVRASNRRAIDLYLSFGFHEVGVRRAYYDHPREDALVMLATLGEQAPRGTGEADRSAPGR